MSTAFNCKAHDRVALGRNDIYVSNVGIPSVEMVPLYMKEIILSRTFMDTNNVAKHSVCRSAENKSYLSMYDIRDVFKL